MNQRPMTQTNQNQTRHKIMMIKQIPKNNINKQTNIQNKEEKKNDKLCAVTSVDLMNIKCT